MEVKFSGMEAGNVRTLVPGESGKVLVCPCVRSDHMAMAISVLDTVHGGSVVNAIVYAYLVNEREKQNWSGYAVVQLFPSGTNLSVVFADHLAELTEEECSFDTCSVQLIYNVITAGHMPVKESLRSGE